MQVIDTKMVCKTRTKAWNAYLESLLIFKLGVELGQVAVILAAFFLLSLLFAKKSYYRKRIVVPLSIAIAAVAAYWTIERIFFV